MEKKRRKKKAIYQDHRIAYDVMEKTKEIIATDVLKISGGEVTTNENLLEFVKKIHKNYPIVQILTNGLNLTKYDIKEYKKLGNICFQISLDGVTGETNYARTHSEMITEKVLKNIDCILKEGMGVEINCVLTKYNTDKFDLFLERFKDADNFIVVPRPVRGEPKKILTFSNEQIIRFKNLLYSNYDKYSKILPPIEYIKRLIKTMESGMRTANCYVPFFVQSIDGYGNFEECPIGLITKSINNIFKFQNNENIHIESHIFEESNLCKNCTNQYEMFNLYVEGKITEGELKKMPSLNSDKIISHIEDIKEDIIKSEIKNILKEKYNIKVKKIEKNEQSTDGNVYIVYCENDKYIIKIYKEIKHTDSMIKLYKRLNLLNLNIPKIIFTKSGKEYEKILNTNYMVIYSFLEGKQIGWNAATGKLDNDVIIVMAKELRKFHRGTSKNEFNLPKVPFKINNRRQSALHFDLTRNNIFIYNNKIGFIDFDDAKYGDSVCDIAILIANLFFSKTRGVDMKGLKKFIDEYYCDEKALKDEEVPLIKEYALRWINYILNGNEFDTSTTESFEIRKKLITENL